MLPTLVFGGRTLSPQWLADEIARVQAGLHALGCAEGETVAVMLRNSPAYVALVLGCRQAGLFVVSINWHFKAAEANHQLVDSAARVLFVDADLLEGIAAGVPEGLPVVTVPSDKADAATVSASATGATPWSAFGVGAAPMPPRAGLTHGNITYTSGTTGKPKGVRRLPAPPALKAAMDRSLRAVMDRVYGSGEPAALVVFLAAPMYHSATMLYLVHFAGKGATMVLEPSFDAERALQLIETHRVNHAYLVPTMYRRLLALDAATRARYDVSSLVKVSSTGSPCSPELKRDMIGWFGPVITEAYGSSETSYITYIDAPAWLQRPGSAGQAVGEAMLRILDDAGQPVPAGTRGLIYVRQPALPDFCYLNNPPARQAIERDGLLTLGDIGYLDDEGYLFICDRKSDMVISGGANIYPAEIELVLQTMPGVADCAVFGIPDAEFGEGLAAAVQRLPGSDFGPPEVQAFLRERLANYKVPRVIDFHAQLPREDTGKIFKRRLREPYWSGEKRSI